MPDQSGIPPDVQQHQTKHTNTHTHPSVKSIHAPERLKALLPSAVEPTFHSPPWITSRLLVCLADSWLWLLLPWLGFLWSLRCWLSSSWMESKVYMQVFRYRVSMGRAGPCLGITMKWLYSFYMEYVKAVIAFSGCDWKVKVAQLCLTLCNPMDYTFHGILQARILEWVAFPFSRGSSQPRDWSQVSHTAGDFFTSWAAREAQEYWSGQPIPSPVDLPNIGIEPASPALQADSFPASREAHKVWLAGPLWGQTQLPGDPQSVTPQEDVLSCLGSREMKAAGRWCMDLYNNINVFSLPQS